MPTSDSITSQRIPLSTRSSDRAARFERLPVFIFDDTDSMATQIAKRIANLIQSRQAVGENVVLGLPTGSTPIGVYQKLARMHREEDLDFSNVVTFNLDEYYPISPDSLQSYHRFMHENLFELVNIPEENIHIPDGQIARNDIETSCLTYEHKIAKAGGLDLLLLGIGRSGHIGFNEPGSGPETRTRLIVLDEITRKDAASDFFAEEHVPREAITMGVGTILEAREIILMATGEHKAPIIKRAVEDEPNRHVTATYLQLHANSMFFVDRAASNELTRIKTPWVVEDVEWTPASAKRAVIWLSEKLQKPILKLDASDFYQSHMHSLVNSYGSVDDLCSQVFEDLRKRIHYKDDLPKRKKIILFSPHPDDDVISMGGMLDKLVQNGNDVTVAYMTNGSVAVFDEDVERHLRFYSMTNRIIGEGDKESAAIDRLMTFLANKEPAAVDTTEIQEIKASIRYTEAIAGIQALGLEAEAARFLDMPFYKTGRVKKDPISKADIDVVLNLLSELRPHHVFVAGDLSDPHGTHRMCYSAIKQALQEYNTERESGNPEPLVWLYRGAWQEWEIDRADIFLPISKSALERKINAIFKHESQKDRALFPGAYDDREFWQRARDRNQNTAERLRELGLPSFFAAEAYVCTNEMP